jgi:hypothetical protein
MDQIVATNCPTCGSPARPVRLITAATDGRTGCRDDWHEATPDTHAPFHITDLGPGRSPFDDLPNVRKAGPQIPVTREMANAPNPYDTLGELDFTDDRELTAREESANPAPTGNPENPPSVTPDPSPRGIAHYWADVARRGTGRPANPNVAAWDALAEASARGEPVHVIRASDIHALVVLDSAIQWAQYHQVRKGTPYPDYIRHLHELADEFRTWQAHNIDHVTVPGAPTP